MFIEQKYREHIYLYYLFLIKEKKQVESTCYLRRFHFPLCQGGNRNGPLGFLFQDRPSTLSRCMSLRI